MLEYGKITTIESFHNGKLKNTKTEYSIPKLISDKGQLLSEIMACLDLINSKKTRKLEIIIESDQYTFKPKIITKKYIVE